MTERNRDNESWDLPSAVILAHELRSSLAAIALAAANLRRHVATDTQDNRAAQDVQIIESSVRRASELTSWVLDNATGSAERPGTRGPLDIVALVRDVCHDVQHVVSEQAVHITAPAELLVAADHVPVRAMVTNLILHAARRGVDGSAIDIEVRNGS